jgi:hypothetical protein
MFREYLRRIALWRVGEMVAIYFITCKINKFLFMCIFFFLSANWIEQPIATFV